MSAFGDFETVGEPVATQEERRHVTTVWKARKTAGGERRDYALKFCSPQRVAREEASGEDRLGRDDALKYLEGIKDLRKAGAQSGSCLAPVHDVGVTPEGAWYVMDFYPRPLAQFIKLRGRVDPAGLRHVIGCVIAGCLALKRARGYSHGNLKTSNIFLVGKPRALRRTAIHLADPFPASSGQWTKLDAGDEPAVGALLQQSIELQDLRAIGELIFQLVEGRIIHAGENEYDYPLRISPGWRALGKDAEPMLEWCNRLLDPHLSLERLNLETLAREFRPAAPSRLPLILAAAGVCAVVAGAAVFIPHLIPPKIINTVPTAGAITFGQALQDSTLAGGAATVAGKFAFAEPAAKPGAGNSAQTVIFTPFDHLKFNPVTLKVQVQVNKATPQVDAAPTAAAISFGQDLRNSALSGGAASVPGQFEFANPRATPRVGTARQGVTFVPADGADYNSIDTNVAVTVNKVPAQITTPPTARAITTGQTLRDSSLDGGIASTAGDFAFAAPATRPAATAEQGVVFTPADAADYDPVSLSVIVQVAPKQTIPVVAIQNVITTPVIRTPPTASDITFGQALGASILSGGAADAPGSFAFATPAAAPHAGLPAQSVVFTPADTNKYNRVTLTVKVAVSKATPRITAAPAASEIAYGQDLGDCVLSGGEASTPGAFAFTDHSIKPSLGTSTQSVTFTPAEIGDYNSVTINVAVAVKKHAVVIARQPAASAITLGQPLRDSILSGGAADTPGAFAFATPSIPAHAGVLRQRVTFTPADTNLYGPASMMVSVTVNKAAPRITAPPVAGEIAFGQNLAGSVLRGGDASTAGSFAFTDRSIKPSVGTSAQSVTFTPAAAGDYNPVTINVPVTVKKRQAAITTQPAASAITLGQPLGDSILSGGVADTPGTFAFTTLSVPAHAGVLTQSVTFTPADTNVCSPASTTINVTVKKAAPRITTAPTASEITQGKELKSSALTGGGASTAGSFAFTLPSTIPSVGKAAQSVTFTPKDGSDYDSATCMVYVSVILPPPVKVEPPPLTAMLSVPGFDFVWVPAILKGRGAYVETTELSRSQFVNKKLGGKADPNLQCVTDDNDQTEMPVGLTFEDAKALCARLNQGQPGGQFALPSTDDFLIYSSAREVAGTDNPEFSSLIGEFRAIHARIAFDGVPPESPGLVNAAATNRYALKDVLGNVWEWCAAGDAGVAAGFSSFSNGARANKLFEPRSELSDTAVIGVRLLFIPNH